METEILERCLALAHGIHDELIANGPSDRWEVSREGLKTLLFSFAAQIKHEKMKTEFNGLADSPDGGGSIDANSLKMFKEISSVNRKIERQLTILRRRK